jgi:hypothetical protein
VGSPHRTRRSPSSPPTPAGSSSNRT